MLPISNGVTGITGLSISGQAKINTSSNNTTDNHAPVLVLKELVASLQREQNKIQNLLSSLGFALRSFSNLNQFLEITPLMAARVTDAQGGALILLKSDRTIELQHLYCHKNELAHTIRQGFDSISTKINFSGNGFSGNGVADNSPNQEKDKMPLSELVDNLLASQFNPKIQVFGTPVLVKNIEIGRLYVFSTDVNYIWTQTKRKLAQLVADQTAVAIANNQLTVELRQKERIDRELEIASEIQERLLPRKCPQIKGVEITAHCQTANRVGGDYYDFIPANYDKLDDSPEVLARQAREVCWSIVIGDVMGKGVPAGLIMTMTRGMLRAEVLNRHSPGRILQHLNRVMYADLENSHRFVTLFYSQYDPETKILSYANAAHNPPLLWQAATNSIYKLDTLGMLIGLDANSDYEEASVQLAPGDTIMYYTDGFTDTVDQKGERFDEENLYRTFSWACENCSTTQAILDHIFDTVGDFVGKGNNHIDDMTLVVMKILNS